MEFRKDPEEVVAQFRNRIGRAVVGLAGDPDNIMALDSAAGEFATARYFAASGLADVEDSQREKYAAELDSIELELVSALPPEVAAALKEVLVTNSSLEENEEIKGIQRANEERAREETQRRQSEVEKLYRRLHAAQETEMLARDDIAACVRQLRARGETWASIGSRFGITAQGAQQRFTRHSQKS